MTAIEQHQEAARKYATALDALSNSGRSASEEMLARVNSARAEFWLTKLTLRLDGR